MLKIDELVQKLGTFYNHNPQSILGYLMAVVREMEQADEVNKNILAGHIDWIQKGIDDAEGK